MDGEKPLNPSDLQSLVEEYLVTSIEIYNPKGNLLRGSPFPPLPFKRESFLRDLVERKHSVAIDLFGKTFPKDRLFYSRFREKSALESSLFNSTEIR